MSTNASRGESIVDPADDCLNNSPKDVAKGSDYAILRMSKPIQAKIEPLALPGFKSLKDVSHGRMRLREDTVKNLLFDYNTKPIPIPPSRAPKKKWKIPCFELRIFCGCPHYLDLHTLVLSCNDDRDGIMIDHNDEDYMEKVHRAIKSVHRRQPQKLNSLDYQGRSALSLAVKLNLHKMVRLFCSVPQIDVDVRDEKTNMTPLHHAAHLGSVRIIDSLLQRGANVKAVDFHEMCPLMIACSKGNKDAVQMLLDKGYADPEQSDEASWNSLFHAAYAGHLEIVKIILAEGVNKDKKDKQRAKAIDWAMLKEHYHVVSYLEYYKFKPKLNSKRVSWG